MNTKKIWLFAMVFGVLATLMMFMMVSGEPKKSAPPAATEVADAKDKEKKVPEKIEVEEPKKNEIISISNGKRAMSVAVQDPQGVAGFITPGSFVDVVAVMKVPEEYKEKQHDAATLLLQNVKILAIGHAADDEETKKRYQMVTIEVTPKEGLALGFATNYDLYLMLRSEGDDKVEPKHMHIHEDDLHEGVFR
ncbi:Flp pilus assembly protein CpaB [Lederbergia wuyishanensis]|uniref:Pilus assembly protein CpaB n=1 Tax=Lederbergia wuyishanensis TaxID=1347903 RepID=A0ABU0D8A0_9BACI|nr:Flp pilus assembly protein CpaB [Lederbergia wuyishanensis]MCJ8009234.1 Flp pilus assembly protein CpaB [Lederbergia wuyishanensis]MDQ0344633.1 pilus assembly protein CpaB [Lederbergia wuyishanensis]